MTSIADLAGRLAVVTGAGSGIGDAFARTSAERGLRVLALDVNERRLDALASWAAANGHDLRTGVADVGDYGAVERAASTVTDWGAAALIVNNAGVEFTGRVWETDPAAWARVQAINVNGVFNVTRRFVPDLLADGRPGHVVMMSSLAGLSTSRGNSGYVCSKFSVRVLAQCLRDELAAAASHVGVTSVHPGPVRTNIFQDSRSAGDAGSALRGRLGTLLDTDGIDPSDVVRLTFDAVEAGRFWVHTHPELSQRAVERQDAEVRAGLAQDVGTDLVPGS